MRVSHFHLETSVEAPRGKRGLGRFETGQTSVGGSLLHVFVCVHTHVATRVHLGLWGSLTGICKYAELPGQRALGIHLSPSKC